MRYIKTYESFSTNEEFLGKLMNKISSAFTNWKNDKLKKAGDKLAQAIEENKNDPEMVKALADLKVAYSSLPKEVQLKCLVKLAELPRDCSRVRLRNRCAITARSRGHLRFFRMSRISFREFAGEGLLPGVFKASW